MKTYQQTGNSSLLIINHKSSQKVFVRQVVLLEGDINYTIVHLDTGKRKMIPHPIKFFEPFLEQHGFLRVHRSYLINPNFIKTCNLGNNEVQMTNGQTAIIARRRQNILKNFVE